MFRLEKDLKSAQRATLVTQAGGCGETDSIPAAESANHPFLAPCPPATKPGSPKSDRVLYSRQRNIKQTRGRLFATDTHADSLVLHKAISSPPVHPRPACSHTATPSIAVRGAEGAIAPRHAVAQSGCEAHRRGHARMKILLRNNRREPADARAGDCSPQDSAFDGA